MGKLFCKDLDCSKYFDIEKLVRVYATDDIKVIGKTVVTDSRHRIKVKDLRIFLTTIKQVIESDFFQGYLTIPIQILLVNMDIKRNICVDDNGYPISLTNKPPIDHKKSLSKNIRYRSMLLFYFKSPLTKEEINKKFGKDICVAETELPNMWD